MQKIHFSYKALEGTCIGDGTGGRCGPGNAFRRFLFWKGGVIIQKPDIERKDFSGDFSRIIRKLRATAETLINFDPANLDPTDRNVLRGYVYVLEQATNDLRFIDHSLDWSTPKRIRNRN